MLIYIYMCVSIIFCMSCTIKFVEYSLGDYDVLEIRKVLIGDVFDSYSFMICYLIN